MEVVKKYMFIISLHKKQKWLSYGALAPLRQPRLSPLCGCERELIRNVCFSTFLVAEGQIAFYEKYLKDVKSGKLDVFLLKNLLWTSLTHYSHMRSLYGSDGRFYRNEICFDKNTIASEKIKELEMNEDEQKLITIWNKILFQAKETENYNPEFTYGLYQIDDELNTSHKDDKGKNIPDYPELNGNIKALKALLKDYYLKEIAPVLFEYEMLK